MPPNLIIGKIEQITNEPIAPDIAQLSTTAKINWPNVFRTVQLRELLPTDHALQREVANDFKSGQSMHTLARQWGVDVLVIEDVIRQVLRRLP